MSSWNDTTNLHHKNTVRINVYLAKYSRYRKFRYFSTRIRVNELSNLNKNTQNLSILVCYANFYVKNLRTNNDKMTQFHWSRKSRDSCQPALQPPIYIRMHYKHDRYCWLKYFSHIHCICVYVIKCFVFYSFLSWTDFCMSAVILRPIFRQYLKILGYNTS